MCVVSMIGDHYQDKWKNLKQYIPTPYYGPEPLSKPLELVFDGKLFVPAVTIEEFEALKKEVEDMKVLLKKAKIYDEQNNEPDCEMEGKIAFLKQVANFVGIDLEEVFGAKGKVD